MFFKKKEENQWQNTPGEPKPVDIGRYKDLGGITIKKLEQGLWYVEHRELFRKIFIWLLVAVSASFWSYSIYGFAYYFARGMKEDEVMIKQMIETGSVSHKYILEISAVDLASKQVKIFKLDGKKSDFFAEVINPNENYSAVFDYYFTAGAKETARMRGFILPGENKYLLALGQEIENQSRDAQLKIENIAWSRINKHKFPDWNLYRDERLNIAVYDIKFTPSKEGGLSEKIGLNTLGFKAIDKSAYSYLNADFVILLYSGQNIIGVNSYPLERFMSGEERPARMTFPGKIGNVNKVEVIPNINILDESNYLKP
jgi:hypothetical protein